MATEGCTYKLDEIWEHISEPIPPEKLKKECPEEDNDQYSGGKKPKKFSPGKAFSQTFVPKPNFH